MENLNKNEQCKTIGLRFTIDTYDLLMEIMSTNNYLLKKNFGFEITIGSNLLRFAIVNLLLRAPEDKDKDFLIAHCRNDKSFRALLDKFDEGSQNLHSIIKNY